MRSGRRLELAQSVRPLDHLQLGIRMRRKVLQYSARANRPWNRDMLIHCVLRGTHRDGFFNWWSNMWPCIGSTGKQPTIVILPLRCIPRCLPLQGGAALEVFEKAAKNQPEEVVDIQASHTEVLAIRREVREAALQLFFNTCRHDESCLKRLTFQF